ncbi:MAG: hypothetical protein GF383_15440 [Candidatus Lokiarchaeota archaeon]|nr:hypothetical protein [Candidatus Lokiarchaeota archaeon]MBD3342937.1 hypothetical protein [Candidatus Lokiarchaeota archaeon]
MRYLKGMYFEMVNNLLNEYNPEMAEEAAKELSFEIASVKPGKWYDRTEMFKYINKASPAARKALAKRVFPTIKENTPLLDDCNGPIDVIKKMNESSALTNKGDVLPEYNVLELDKARAKIQVKNNWIDFPDIEEGQILGIFQMYKILRVHVDTTKVSDNELIMDVKWEN